MRTFMNSHKVEIVPIKLEPHKNADSLSIVKVYGFTVCVRTADWIGIEKGAYIQPDSIAPATEQFSFLGKNRRIRVKMLRGVVSMGMLIPAPEGANIGDDVAEIIGITHYEPIIKMRGSGDEESPPFGVYAPKYHMENMLRYSYLFEEGESVFVTEKIHGANARFVFHGKRMWCGSKSTWKKESEGNLWWQALYQNEWIREFCINNPGDVVYGEIFGNVQSLRYGAFGNQVFFRVFDVLLKGGTWEEFHNLYKDDDKYKALQIVPCLGIFSFSLEIIKELAEGKTLFSGADHIREGVVVRPIYNRCADEIGRLQLKLVSNVYLESN